MECCCGNMALGEFIKLVQKRINMGAAYDHQSAEQLLLSPMTIFYRWHEKATTKRKMIVAVKLKLKNTAAMFPHYDAKIVENIQKELQSQLMSYLQFCDKEGGMSNRPRLEYCSCTVTFPVLGLSGSHLQHCLLTCLGHH